MDLFLVALCAYAHFRYQWVGSAVVAVAIIGGHLRQHRGEPCCDCVHCVFLLCVDAVRLDCCVSAIQHHSLPQPSEVPAEWQLSCVRWTPCSDAKHLLHGQLLKPTRKRQWHTVFSLPIAQVSHTSMKHVDCGCSSREPRWLAVVTDEQCSNM